MPTITFDCDGVLLDWEGGFAAWMAEVHDILVDPNGPQDYSLSEWIGCDAMSVVRYVREFNESEHFTQLSALPGAKEAVRLLYANEFTLRVLTACGDTPSVSAARVNNLRKVFTAHSFERVEVVGLGASKVSHLKNLPAGSWWVEDNYGHALDGLEVGLKPLMIRNTHNRAQEAACRCPDIEWFDTAFDAANHILKVQTRELL